jgi:hypothetical protein
VTAPGGSAPVQRVTPLTIFVQLKFGGAVWMRLLLIGAKYIGFVTAPLRALSFIHYARWTVLPGRWLHFESNFDGDLPQYIDTFAHALRWRMRLAWGMGKGYPGLIPADRYARWSDANTFSESHYYAAYPDASTTMVGAALRVESRFRQFLESTEEADAETFAAAYRRFLTDVQQDL